MAASASYGGSLPGRTGCKGLCTVRVAGMDIDLSGRVVAVTGASSGIGEATALACAEAGAAVSLAARRPDRIEALAERIRSAGGTALAVETDVSDEARANAFVRRTH